MLYVVSGANPSRIKTSIGDLISTRVGVENQLIKFEENMTLPAPKGGDVYLFMGAKALAWLGTQGLVAKNRAVPSMRQRPIPFGEAMIYITYDPFAAEGDYRIGIDIKIDACLAARTHRTKMISPVIGAYDWVTDFKEAIVDIELMFAKTGKKVDVCMDLETVGLDEFNLDAWIVSISISWKKGKSHLVYFEGRNEYPNDELTWQILWLLTTDKISMRGANFKYDCRWMRQHWGLVCTNFKMDTTLVGSLLDENRSNSLEVHSWLYTDMGGYDSHLNQNYDKGAMHKVPQDVLLPYAGGDTDACLQISGRLKEDLLKDQKLANFYVNLLHPSAMVFERMESKGLPVDQEAYAQLREDLSVEMVAVQEAADKLFSGRLKAKHFKHKDKTKLSRGAVIEDYMFSPLGLDLKPLDYTDKGSISTAKEHLMKFYSVPEAKEFVSLVTRYNKASKMRGTYVDGFLKHLRSDGRFHATYMLFKSDDGGTNTGRLSCLDPPLQTLPKHDKIWAPKFRNCFPAPEGYVWVAIDYSQGELRVAADIANEKTMLKLYQDGVDLHLIAGAVALGIEPKIALAMSDTDVIVDPLGVKQTRKTIRQNGKASNFGFLYGMQAEGYVTYARDTYGVEVTKKQAEFQRSEFFNLYTGLEAWHRYSVSTAHKYGYIRSPLGRIRHLPLIGSKDWETKGKEERRAINAPVQGTLSDLTQFAGVTFEKEYGITPECFPVTMTHDELVFAVLADKVDIWVPRLVDVFENLPLGQTFGWYPKVKFVAEPEIGVRLGAMKPYVPAS